MCICYHFHLYQHLLSIFHSVLGGGGFSNFKKGELDKYIVGEIKGEKKIFRIKDGEPNF